MEHATFTPLMLSTTEGMGRAASIFFKRLASLLSDKRNIHYNKGVIMGCTRTTKIEEFFFNTVMVISVALRKVFMCTCVQTYTMNLVRKTFTVWVYTHTVNLVRKTFFVQVHTHTVNLVRKTFIV